MNLFLIALAVFPTVILISFLLFFDRYEREPASLLIKVFFFGCVCTIPTIVAETVGEVFNIYSGITGAAFRAFVVVALSEELFKRRVVLKRAYYDPNFNERLDGIIYCSFASLGFATVENIKYVLTYYSENSSIWITRALLSVPAHMLLGITMGYFLSMAKFSLNQRESNKYMRKSLLIPLILHGIFDFILMSEMPLLLLLFIPFVIYLWISSMKKLKQYYNESKNIHTNNLV